MTLGASPSLAHFFHAESREFPERLVLSVVSRYSLQLLSLLYECLQFRKELFDWVIIRIVWRKVHQNDTCIAQSCRMLSE